MSINRVSAILAEATESPQTATNDGRARLRRAVRPRLMAGAAVVLALAAAPAALLSSTASAAVPAVRTCNTPPAHWAIHTAAVNIRSRPSVNSTAVGVLYRGQSFHVYWSNGSWVHIKDTSTGVTGYVSEKYVYKNGYTCLD